MFRAPRICSVIALLVWSGLSLWLNRANPVEQMRSGISWSQAITASSLERRGRGIWQLERKGLTDARRPLRCRTRLLSDSRVPPELVFDAGLGDLFVVRAAGEDDDPMIGSLEYAVEHLGSTVIVVIGASTLWRSDSRLFRGKDRIAQSRSGACSYYPRVPRLIGAQPGNLDLAARPRASGCRGNTRQQRGAERVLQKGS